MYNLYLCGSLTNLYIHNATSRAYPTLALWTVNPPNVDQVRLFHQIVLTGAIPYAGVNGLTVGILHLYLLKLETTKMEPITTLYTIIIQRSINTHVHTCTHMYTHVHNYMTWQCRRGKSSQSLIASCSLD